METIRTEPRKFTDDFWIVMREDIDAPLVHRYTELAPDDDDSRFGDCPFRLYQSREKAIEAATDYLTYRNRNGQKYRYYVLKTVAVICTKPEGDDNG